MAHYSRHAMSQNKDFWEEESLPDFSEVFLQEDDKPTDGKIYTMFHGTTSAAAERIINNGFIQSAHGMLGKGVYVSRDLEKALRYPLENKADQVILKLRVNVGQVIKIDRQDHPLQKTWHYRGYDTAWVPASCGMVKSNLEEDCVWDPDRVKVVGVAYVGQDRMHQYLVTLFENYSKEFEVKIYI